MAGFLRKKTKQEVRGPPTISSPVTLASSTAPPPLYAKFTTASTHDVQMTQRVVSSPTTPRKDREGPVKGAGGRVGSAYSSTSVAAGSRDAEIAQRRVQGQPLVPPSTTKPASYAPDPHPRTGELTVPRPVSKVFLDKPLPSPAFSDLSSGSSAPAVNRRTTSTRALPPSTFQRQEVLPRSTPDIQERDSKPLPRPGSAQSYYQPPPSTFNPTSRRRNGSLSSTSNAPQIGLPNRKMQPYPDHNYASQILSPKQNAHGNGPLANGNGNLVSSGMDADSHLEFTPVSVRAIDLPPEAALYQEYSETISVPSPPNSLNSRRPATSNGITMKSTELVPDSSRPRSGIYGDARRHPSPPSSNPQFASTSRPLPIPSPPLPPPPLAQAPAFEMGVAVSQQSTSDAFPSSYKDFYPHHVVVGINEQNSTYNNANVNLQQPPTSQSRRQSQPERLPARSNSRSTSQPLPPGAAFPSHYQSFQQPHQDTPLPAPARRQHPDFPQQYQEQHQQPSFPHIPPQLPVTVEPQPPRAPFPKPANMQAASTPMPMTRGKPRIFAAMEAQENEPEPAPIFHSPSPRRPLPSFPQPQNQMNGPKRAATLPQNPSPSPNPSVAIQRQSYAEPAAEPILMTPRSRLDPFPSFSNGVASSALDVDPPPMFASTLAASPPKLAPPFEQSHMQPPTQPHTPKSISKSLPRQSQDDARPNPSQGFLSPQTPPRTRKLSRTRNPPDAASVHGSIGTPSHKSSLKTRPNTPGSSHKASSVSSHSHGHGQLEPPVQLDEETKWKAGIPLDDDPFACVEGVKLLKSATPPPGAKKPKKGSMKEPSNTDSVYEDAVDSTLDEPRKHNGVALPLTPESPEGFKQARNGSQAPPPPTVESVIAQKDLVPRDPVTMTQLLSHPQLLACLLSFLSFYDWCILSSLSKEIRIQLVRTPLLRQEVLERFLKPVGYARWSWDDREPLSLSLQDLSDYMRGVSTPTHEYARVAGMYVHSFSIHPNHRDPSLEDTVRSMTTSARAYTRVLLRLRAQAEKEASLAQVPSPTNPPVAGKNFNFSPSRGSGTASRMSSRAPSPTSNYSQSHNGHANGNGNGVIQAAASTTSLSFRSPLFRLRRAPLLRVFVPSPEGDWLSDKSVLECEAECKRAGVAHLMRLGDVVWDVAVGDEGNVGRLVWDGSYLIDLDYTYSAIGDLPKYMPTLAFPPSYFHKVIRTGSQSTNPIAHIDLSPWGEEIAMNLQLLQDRVKTETPQGAYHNVMRWVHRSSFTIRSPRSGPRHGHSQSVSGPKAALNGRIPIPDTDNLFVDPGWYGTIVVETEGTNEALADLQDRCGPGAFPPRPRPLHGQIHQSQVENRKVFRILREKSRPGEIWICAVGVKERLM